MTKRIDDPEYAWRDHLKVGDVLVTPSGDLRVVREVSYWGPNSRWGRAGLLQSVTLAIRHCSWTGKGGTHVGRVALRQRKFRLLAQNIEVAITDVNSLTCCEAKHLA